MMNEIATNRAPDAGFGTLALDTLPNHARISVNYGPFSSIVAGRGAANAEKTLHLTSLESRMEESPAKIYLQYDLALICELEQMEDLDQRAHQLFIAQIWGTCPRSNALLRSVAEAGMVGRILQTRTDRAQPVPKPHRKRPRQPEQHKLRTPAPQQPPLLNLLQELLPRATQAGGQGAEI